MPAQSAMRCISVSTQQWSVAPHFSTKNLTGVVPTLQARSNSSKPESKPEEEEDDGPNWKVIVGFGLFAASLGAFLNIRHYERTQRQLAEKEKDIEANVGVGGHSVTGASTGRPDLGGDFMLINQDGKLTKNQDFLGQWMLLYFGFTYCPDICPNELMRMVEVLDLLDKEPRTASKLLPIFVTIDPERDGPAQLKDYLSDWHPRLVGLTGSPAQIKDVCSKYRVYYSKAVMGTNAEDYLIDHSVMFYLVDPAGQFVEYYGQNTSVEEMHKKIAKHIQALTA